MDRNEPTVYQIRDFPLSLVDAQAELDSVQHVLNERSGFGECWVGWGEWGWGWECEGVGRWRCEGVGGGVGRVGVGGCEEAWGEGVWGCGGVGGDVRV